ncbi:Hypothetical Protein FCC1311_021432 [Hondaea fermentalgiana]|uniref:Ribosome biogenesis protein NOP53 n=1 Tax=Hondaea fermentalgiana TaxID=2315210 RepID=A0A2R5GDQ0_9STRA|nr:Hypothetical Protein FCC1311_021432 [Hondaea fermentalgiana]|eukprot:GBG25924.1 Hypothetical Protein FCC1311_021432 [Hondaea fermentalgiana]
MVRPKIGKRGARNRKSKYSGKGLNDELTSALSGPGGKSDDSLFFEDTDEKKLSRKALARKRREEEDRAEEELRKNPITSKTEAALMRKRALPSASASSSSSSSATKAKGKTEKDKNEQTMQDLWADEADKASRKARQALFGRKSRADLVPALRNPTESASYNPEAEAYRKGLAKTVDDVIAYEASLHSYSKPAGLNANFQRRNDVKKGLAVHRGGELGASDDESSSGSEDEEEEDEEETKETEDSDGNPTKKRKRDELAPGERITRRERNRAKRRAAHELMMKKKAQKKMLLESLANIDQAVDDVDAQEAAAAEKAKEKSESEAIKAATEPVALINSRPVKRRPLVDSALPSDLSSTLRQIKPHSDLALERFYSLHQRNKMEVGDATRRNSQRPRPRVKHVPVGKPFMEIEHNRTDGKKKNKRFMRHGKVSIS